MSFKTKPETAPMPPPADTSLAKWRAMTEALIFAAPYGTSEYLRHLDATGRPYNRDQAIQRCKAIAEAVMAYDSVEVERIEWEEPEADWHGSLREALESGAARKVIVKVPLPFRLQRCHAANDDPTFRLRYGHVLPKRPTMPTPAERRTGISDEERMTRAMQTAEAL